MAQVPARLAHVISPVRSFASTFHRVGRCLSLDVSTRARWVVVFLAAMGVSSTSHASLLEVGADEGRVASFHDASDRGDETDAGKDSKQKPRKKKASGSAAADVDSLVTDASAESSNEESSKEDDEAREPIDLGDDATDEAEDEDVSEAEDEEPDEPKARRRAGSRTPAAMRGRLGIGALRTVSGLNGLTARYYLADRFTLGLVGGVALFTHGETGEDGEFNERRTVGLMGVGTDLLFWPVQGDRNNQIYADVGVGLRGMLYLGFDRYTGEEEEDEEDNTIDRPMEIDIEIPVAIKLWVGQNVAFVPELGAVVRIIPGSREADQQGNVDENPGTGIGEKLGTTNGPGLGLEFGSHAGMFVGLGIFYFFGGR